MTWHSLPLFVRMAGRPVILLGEGEAADAKRRLLERAGATIVGEDATPEGVGAALAIVAIDDEATAVAAVERLRARGILVNAVDRPSLCDFTLPAIVDRDPVLVAIGTGGVSAGLAAALRQRLERVLPHRLGELAKELFHSRAQLRQRWPDPAERRRMIAAALAPGGFLDLLGPHNADDPVGQYVLAAAAAPVGAIEHLRLASADPDDLTLRQARLLANADRLYHTAAVPAAILDRARADAGRIACAEPPVGPIAGSAVWLEMT